MASKVSFDPITRIISVTAPPVNGELVPDFKTDFYSDGKEDWLVTPSLRKLRFPISAIGGNQLPTRKLGTTFFVNSSWKIRPYESSHRLIIIGNVYSVDGSSPIIPTIGNYQVLLEREVSNIVDSPQVTLADLNIPTELQNAEAVWQHLKALTVAKFLALK